MSVFGNAVIADPLGLHARPAAEFVTAARGFDAELSVATETKQANCKSLLSVLALGVTQGTTVTITATGPDEEAALAALTSLLASQGEDSKTP